MLNTETFDIYAHLFPYTLAAARGRHQQIRLCSAWHSHRCSPPAPGPPRRHRPAPQRETPAPCEPAPPTHPRQLHMLVMMAFPLTSIQIILDLIDVGVTLKTGQN